MTRGEKMAEEYLETYEWPMAPHNIAALIHQVAERTRIDIIGQMEYYGEAQSKWEDEEAE